MPRVSLNESPRFLSESEALLGCDSLNCLKYLPWDEANVSAGIQAGPDPGSDTLTHILGVCVCTHGNFSRNSFMLEVKVSKKIHILSLQHAEET